MNFNRTIAFLLSQVTWLSHLLIRRTFRCVKNCVCTFSQSVNLIWRILIVFKTWWFVWITDLLPIWGRVIFTNFLWWWTLFFNLLLVCWNLNIVHMSIDFFNSRSNSWSFKTIFHWRLIGLQTALSIKLLLAWLYNNKRFLYRLSLSFIAALLRYCPSQIWNWSNRQSTWILVIICMFTRVSKFVLR